ncbi:TraB/GumN family protein [Paracoccaceae bacterium]|nr:TraB/GumN family protein [Paracoccaceae bacterium]
MVVAVGAAHLHGSDGVLARLKSAGYRLSRQEF